MLNPIELIKKFKSWQLSASILVVAMLLLALVIYEIDRASPVTVWLLGALVLIGLSILSMLWRLQSTLQWSAATPFWGAYQKIVADSLHHPHPESAVLDKYLEELEALSLTPQRRDELEELLRRKRDDQNESPKERDRAEQLLFIMRQVVKEQAKATDAPEPAGA
jgi:hypothetical protein